MTAETTTPPPTEASALAVFRNAGFLRLWLSQAATQIGGNMVLYGLTVIVVDSTGSKTAVSLLILTFLVPAVLFSAVAGVYVDRIEGRTILVATNLLRGLAFVALYLAGANLAVILILNIFVSTVTVFFAPAEAAMIPNLVPRSQLLAANGIFTLTLNAAFALGFALLGPLVVNIASPEAVILVVAALYFLAAVFCFTLPSSPPPHDAEVHGLGVSEAEQAMGSTFSQLREGIAFIRSNRSVGWSLLYLGITASLVGVLGVLGPDFARQTLGLAAKDFAVVVLPLGFGIVTGILLLNSVRPVPAAPAGHRGRPDRARDHARVAVGRGADQPPAAARRRAGRARSLERHVAADGRRGHRARGGHRLRLRSRSRRRPSSRRTCPRTSADACSGS